VKRYLDKVREAHKGEEVTSAKLKKHDQQVTDTRNLLIRITYTDALQTPAVATALAPVQKVVDKLVTTLARGKPESLDAVAAVIAELRHATLDLHRRLPGNYADASRNRASGAPQFNAPVGDLKLEGTVGSSANDNEADNAPQFNSYFVGDPKIILEIIKSQQKGKEDRAA